MVEISTSMTSCKFKHFNLVPIFTKHLRSVKSVWLLLNEQVTNADHCSWLKVVPTPNNGSTEFVRLQRDKVIKQYIGECDKMKLS